MATVGMDSDKVVIMDFRQPTTLVMDLTKHKASVNAISWSPHMGRRLCSCGDDSRALIWDLVGTIGSQPRITGGADVKPDLCYESTAAEINQVRWSLVQMDWIVLALANLLQLLKV
ncbi:hypothetical protein QN277_013146 [Acacia crassicarpa]|uniref:Uncharacterized protein n=1 Tax=Acacia crassicarpa TaxID=499986 RepID=A0AAE1N230_9FABA|nr:hypothetical protein QN277_013146 [Acacia crassicarpa]